MPYRLAVHTKHRDHIDEFLQSDAVKLAMYVLVCLLCRLKALNVVLSKVGNELFEKYFPKAALFLNGLNDFWSMQTEGKTVMEFGHFYTMAINFPINHEVQSIPHMDSLNLAPVPCAIMPFGEVMYLYFLLQTLNDINLQVSFHLAFVRSLLTTR